MSSTFLFPSSGVQCQVDQEPRFTSGSLKKRAPEPLRKPVVKKPEPKTVPVRRTVSPVPSSPVSSSHQETPPKPSPGHCELNPFMTKALNMELEDVMMKAFQALPDDPKTDAEKYAVEKLKTDTGDDIRHVLGLNVAKRLLNIFNPLHMKIYFSNIPQRTSMRSFLKKYSFISFKRVEGSTKTFSAAVKTIQDFDRLCSGDDLRCGSSKVTISPNYKFTHCPTKLKAIEKIDSTKKRLKTSSDNMKTNIKNENLTKDELQNEQTKALDIKDKDRVVASINTKPCDKVTQVKAETKTETQVQSPQVKQEPKPQVKIETSVNSKLPTEPQAKVTPKQTTQSQNAPAKQTSNTSPQVQSSQVKATAAKNLQTQNPQVTKTTVTPTQAQNSQVKPIVNKPQEQKPQPKQTVTNTQQGQNSQAKPTVTKPQGQISQVKAAAENPQGQVVQVKTTTQNKPQGQSPQTKPNVNTKPQVQNPQVKPAASKQQAQNSQVKPNTGTKPTTVTKPQVQNVQVKPVRKPQEKNVTTKLNIKSKPTPKPEKKSYEEKDDFEELDDYDILALMSEGIVLDECSGSDVE